MQIGNKKKYLVRIPGRTGYASNKYGFSCIIIHFRSVTEYDSQLSRTAPQKNRSPGAHALNHSLFQNFSVLVDNSAFLSSRKMSGT